MNAGRDVERLIADWFAEEAVLRAPDRVLEGAGRVVDRTKQRRLRVAWRTTRMPGSLRLAAAAVFGVLFVGGALLVMRPSFESVATSPAPLSSPTAASSPTAPPSASPPASSEPPLIPAMTERTTPGPDGVSVGYPAGWVVEDNAVHWLLNGEPDSRPRVSFYVESSRLEASQTAEEWVADRAAEASGGLVTCPRSAGPTEITIGSRVNRGILLSNDCSVAGHRHHYLAVLVEGDRGYSFHMDTTQKNSREWFDALLANVELGPSASQDP